MTNPDSSAAAPPRLSSAEARDAMRKLALGELTHRNAGTCPQGPKDSSRDQQCPVCQLLARDDLPFDGPNSAEVLHSHATHFARDDWQWTRKTNIEAIRYTNDFDGYNSRKNRAVRALREAFGRDRSGLGKAFATPGASVWARALTNVLTRWCMARATLKRDRNLPDGHLENASVIAFWEEDGEYLQYVQPSVGILLAEFLAADPQHPHAAAITQEIDRIRDDYGRRIRAGLVDGRQRTTDEDDTER